MTGQFAITAGIAATFMGIATTMVLQAAGRQLSVTEQLAIYGGAPCARRCRPGAIVGSRVLALGQEGLGEGCSWESVLAAGICIQRSSCAGRPCCTQAPGAETCMVAGCQPAQSKAMALAAEARVEQLMHLACLLCSWPPWHSGVRVVATGQVQLQAVRPAQISLSSHHSGLRSYSMPMPASARYGGCSLLCSCASSSSCSHVRGQVRVEVCAQSCLIRSKGTELTPGHPHSAECLAQACS